MTYTTDELRGILADATPGPWRVESGDPVSCGNRYFQIEDSMDAIMSNYGCFTGGSHEANARLIAAAPDLAAEVIRLRAIIASCNWYWPDDDTSSDACARSPRDVAYGVGTGEVVGYSRGGVVESRYYAFLEAAPDAESDDDFEVDTATSEEAERLIAEELDRRAGLAAEHPTK